MHDFSSKFNNIIADEWSKAIPGINAPAPPPFSSMNSTPTASQARRIAKSLAAVMDVSPSAKAIGTQTNNFGFVS
jgi:hypothetical protein